MKAKKHEKKRINFITIVLLLFFFIGLSLVLYPTVSNYWNVRHQGEAVSSYDEKVENTNDDEIDKLWEDAQNYNSHIKERKNIYTLTESEQEEYENLLNIDGNGMMGYINIPSLDVTIPIRHSTSDSVLSSAVGHVGWSSLPVGGSGTHCILSGHRGLPSARLFTDLDKLCEGDTFILVILNEELTYEVDQICTVEPSDIGNLEIEDGKDYCTLVTCTPYGINTHRLLVRGHRIETVETNDVHVVSEAVAVDEMAVAAVIAFLILFVLMIIVLLKKPGKESSNKR